MRLSPRGLWRRFKRLTQLSFPRRFPIVQFPNAPLIVASLAGEAGNFVNGNEHTYMASVSYLALTIWAYEEMVHGVNWFRHLLGLVFAIVPGRARRPRVASLIARRKGYGAAGVLFSDHRRREHDVESRIAVDRAVASARASFGSGGVRGAGGDRGRGVCGDGARDGLCGADGRDGIERKVQRKDRGGRARPDALRAQSREHPSSFVQEQRMPEGMAAAHRALEQDEAHGRVRCAWPSRDPAAQQRDAPGHTRWPAPLPLLGGQRQGRGKRRGHQKLRRHMARDRGGDRRGPGAVVHRNHAELPSTPTTSTPTPTTPTTTTPTATTPTTTTPPNEKYGY